MAKGRRYRAERLLAAPAYSGGDSGSGREVSDLPDLSESEVWPGYHPTSHDDSVFADEDVDEGRDLGRQTRHAHGRRWVERNVGGLTLAFEDLYRRGTAAIQPPPLSDRHRAVAASAPVDVPVWRRSGRGSTTTAMREEEEDDEEEEDSPDGGWLPPHEYLARTTGRSMATSSVLEGAGRTLKGRDISRVRDAVWSQTGFFG